MADRTLLRSIFYFFLFFFNAFVSRIRYNSSIDHALITFGNDRFSFYKNSSETTWRNNRQIKFAFVTYKIIIYAVREIVTTRYNHSHFHKLFQFHNGIRNNVKVIHDRFVCEARV